MASLEHALAQLSDGGETTAPTAASAPAAASAAPAANRGEQPTPQAPLVPAPGTAEATPQAIQFA